MIPDSTEPTVLALQSLWQLSATVPLTLGIASHLLVFKRYEVDGYAWQMVFAYMCATVAVFGGYLEPGGFTVGQALLRTLFVTSAYNLGVAGSIFIYRAFFHPLRHFPGPFMAKLTRFYSAASAAKRVKFAEDVQKLHEQYGDIVRIGPRELSINRPSAINVIYEPPTRTTRSPWYAQVSNDVTKISINSTRVLSVHKLRKKAWERGLGTRALSIYAPRVQAKMEHLLGRIEEHIGSPINMTNYCMFFAFDVMGEVGLSKDFHMLENEAEHPAIQGLHTSMLVIGVLGTVPWLLTMISKVPGAAASFEAFTQWCHDQLNEKRRVLKQEKANHGDQDPRDILSWLLKAVEEKDPSAAPGELAIQEDTRLLVIAGSDTTSATLTNALFYLAQNPEVYRKLQSQLREHFPNGVSDWTYEKARTITYLEYIIQETLRLKPPVVPGLARVTPPGGLWVDDVFIPGDTITAVPTFTIQRDERNWSEPLAFKPERWEGKFTEKVVWLPFSRGQWACPGRNLAMLELRMVLSRIAMQYNMEIPAGEYAERFDKDFKDTFTMTLPPLPIVFSRV